MQKKLASYLSLVARDFSGSVLADFLNFVGRRFCGVLYGISGFVHRLACLVHGLVDFFSSPLSRPLSAFFLARSQAEPQQNSSNHQATFLVDRHGSPPSFIYGPLLTPIGIGSKLLLAFVFGAIADRSEEHT